MDLLTDKQYKQKWSQFKYKNPKATKKEIWAFQSSLLSANERAAAIIGELVLQRDDPRSWVMDESDRAYDKAP